MNVGLTGGVVFRADGIVGGFEGLVNDCKGLRGVRNCFEGGQKTAD